MVALELLRLLPLFAMIEAAYPSSRDYYGGNRYGHGSSVRRSAVQWVPYRPVMRTQRSPINYYTVYPYSQSYLEDYYRYYPQESYPVYYPRSAKYDVYHSVMPSYYQEPLADVSDGYYSYYYDIDPSELQEELLQEVEREEREESQPIGHEMLYENEDFTNSNLNKYDKASMAYFQNMLTQKNKNIPFKQQEDYPAFMDYVNFNENDYQDIPATKLPPHYSKQDKQVQDLRKLKYKAPKTQYNDHTNNQNKYFQRNSMHEEYKRSNIEALNIQNSITSSVPKTEVKSKEILKNKPITIKVSPTIAQPSSLQPKKDVRGQKEEVMMRPATPVRFPFNKSLMNIVSNNEKNKRNPSVFDTLKRMLEMEKNLRNKYGEDNLRPVMKKRIISDEDSLSRQLTVLKKSH